MISKQSQRLYQENVAKYEGYDEALGPVAAYLEICFSYNIKRWLPQFSDAGEECWRRMQYLEMFPRKMHFPHLLATLLKHSVIFFKVVKSSTDEMTLILGALTKCAVIWGLIKRNLQVAVYINFKLFPSARIKSGKWTESKYNL